MINSQTACSGLRKDYKISRKGHDVFLKFESQDERREYGGSCFVEFQFCMMPEGTQQNRIFHSIDHWRDDSLYVHGDSPLFSTYKEILETGIHPNMTEGYFDYYGVTYYAPDKIEPIIGRLLSAKPEGYDVLNKWLEEAKQYNGFYILGI